MIAKILKFFPAKKLENTGLKIQIIFGLLGGKYTRISGAKKTRK